MAGQHQDAEAAWKTSRCYIQMEGENIRLNAEVKSQQSKIEAQERTIHAFEQAYRSLLAEVAIHQSAVQHTGAQRVSNIDSLYNSPASFHGNRSSSEHEIVGYVAVSEYKDLQREFSKLQNELREAKKFKLEWGEERRLRLAAVSEAVTLRGGIRVFIRARHNIAESRATKHDIIENRIQLHDLARSRGSTQTSYTFDKVLTQDDHTDADVQSELLPLLEGALDGETLFAFAYGETNSGKTYNMGQLFEVVLSRTFRYQKSCQEQETGTVCISAQCIETYTGGTAFTFPYKLSSSKEKRKIVFHANVSTNEWLIHEEGSGGHRELLQKTELRSINDTRKWYNFAKKHRQTRNIKEDLHGSTTGHNECSSRSHLIFKVFVSTTRPNSTISEGSIFLVDLASSEETPNPKTDRDASVESKAIKESLNELMTLLGTIRSKARRAVLEATDYEIPKFPRGSTLIQALWPVLGRPFPRGVILGTIFTAGRAEENNQTLRVSSDKIMGRAHSRAV